MNSNKKQVWFNINTGEFSDSWETIDNSVMQKFLANEMDEANKNGWKLIEYVCLNDEKFDFYNRMKIVSNTKKEK